MSIGQRVDFLLDFLQPNNAEGTWLVICENAREVDRLFSLYAFKIEQIAATPEPLKIRIPDFQFVLPTRDLRIVSANADVRKLKGLSITKLLICERVGSDSVIEAMLRANVVYRELP